jgi:HK97 family phage major capsid protein
MTIEHRSWSDEARAMVTYASHPRDQRCSECSAPAHPSVKLIGNEYRSLTDRFLGVRPNSSGGNIMSMDRISRQARVDELRAWMEEQSDEFGGDAFTPEVQRAWDNHTSELARHEAILDQASARDQRMIDAVRGGTVRTESGDGRRVDMGGRGVGSYNGSDLAGRARQVIDTAARSDLLPDYAAERATALVERGTNQERSLAARWAIAAGNPDYATGFAKLVADPVRGHLLWTPQEQEAYRAAAAVQGELEERAMSLTAANGGHMVPLVLDPAIMLTSAGSINPLRAISRVVQTVGSQWSGVTSAGATAEWKAEAVQAADASPTLAKPNIPVFLGDAFVPYSYEVGMDAINFLSELQKVLIDSALQLQNTAFTVGGGSTDPKGIITAIVGTASVVVGTEAFPKTQVYSTQAALPPRFQPNAKWAANLAIIHKLAQFETTNGAKEFPGVNEGRLLNRDLVELSNMDGVIDVGAENYSLLYGDFQNFIIVDRIGATLELIPNLVGAAFRPTGQRGALLWFRTGSDAPVFNAFRLLNLT